MKADEATSRQVGEVLKRMLAAYAAKDIEGVMQCYHHWSGVLAIGSSGDEIRLGPGDLRAGFAADFAQPFGPATGANLAVGGRPWRYGLGRCRMPQYNYQRRDGQHCRCQADRGIDQAT